MGAWFAASFHLGGDGSEGALSAAAGLWVVVSARRAWMRDEEGMSLTHGDVACAQPGQTVLLGTMQRKGIFILMQTCTT